ncbi:hypothetical protein Tco_0850237 [Tanacetum coccineum]
MPLRRQIIVDARTIRNTKPKEALVLEKEKLENELLEILAASKQDKESFPKDYYSEDEYVVSIKEYTAYPCLYSPKTTEYLDNSIRRIQDMESI